MTIDGVKPLCTQKNRAKETLTYVNIQILLERGILNNVPFIRTVPSIKPLSPLVVNNSVSVYPKKIKIFASLRSESKSYFQVCFYYT